MRVPTGFGGLGPSEPPANPLETPSQVRPSKDQKQTINKLNIPIPTCSPGAGGSIKDLEFNNLPGSELIKNTNSGMI